MKLTDEEKVERFDDLHVLARKMFDLLQGHTGLVRRACGEGAYRQYNGRLDDLATRHDIIMKEREE